jgi:hypothetical protein
LRAVTQTSKCGKKAGTASKSDNGEISDNQDLQYAYRACITSMRLSLGTRIEIFEDDDDVEADDAAKAVNVYGKTAGDLDLHVIASTKWRT